MWLLMDILFCRDILRRNYNTGQFWVEVQMDDLQMFDENLADLLARKPADYINIVIQLSFCFLKI